MINYAATDDATLLDLMKAGDHDAFTAIYNKYWYPLMQHVMKAVRVYSEAEDIVQELFVSLWKNKSKLEIQYALSTYLYNSARYMAIRNIERNITRSNYLQRLSDQLDNGGVPSPETLLHMRNLEEKIEQAIHDLPDKMREIFNLSRKEQLSYREIATLLGISEETVRKQISNALARLRNQVGYAPVAIIALLSLIPPVH
ncbi:RNA polymerase sigma-70 factor, ECF subfamily [Chitinophaga jiangningensis]|uniref:RNA polymerase sigma-70 factor, ECF subfamily n=1 Tax=Chitinophaga jiangningensis TaxID=1419482 RepID=A0A1M7K0B0_9BACT|nr:RNA polymerase sigma-70 factor [Chitinophaga jiangningensis]SHM58413.1 RNA polymerase sigma-70 factor, ECF subfamily [Chitinophaga jiangningensis]